MEISSLDVTASVWPHNQRQDIGAGISENDFQPQIFCNIGGTCLCVFFFFFFCRTINMSYFGATGTPVLDFW